MKARKKFTWEAKISILRELENGNSSAQVCRENGIHPSMLSKWKREYKENPGIAFSGNGNISKPEAKLAESSKTERRELIYMIIKDMRKETNPISIIKGCSDIGVCRSGYNKWIRQNHTHYSDPEEMKLKNEIHAIAIDFPRYGYRRITIELHRRGFETNHKAVYLDIVTLTFLT